MHVRNAEASTRRMDDVRFRNLITRQECANISIAEAVSPQLRSLRRNFVADRAESLADNLSINVLGGTFMAALQLQGFNVSLAFMATAPNLEYRVIRVLYPDLDERTRELPSVARAQIREHDTGRFVVFAVHTNGLSTAESSWRWV